MLVNYICKRWSPQFRHVTRGQGMKSLNDRYDDNDLQTSAAGAEYCLIIDIETGG